MLEIEGHNCRLSPSVFKVTLNLKSVTLYSHIQGCSFCSLLAFFSKCLNGYFYDQKGWFKP